MRDQPARMPWWLEVAALLAAALLAWNLCHPTRGAAQESEPMIEADAFLETDAAAEVVIDPVLAVRSLTQVIRDAEDQHGITRGRLDSLIRCESSYRWDAVGCWGHCHGIAQFVWSTWLGTPQGRAGLSPYDPVAAIEGAAWLWRRNPGAWPHC